MIQHYFTIAWRNLIRNKFYSFINIAGFAVGIGSALLLGKYSWHEMHYDDFHEKKDRIHLVGVEGKSNGEEWVGGWTTPPLGPALNDYFSEVESYTRLCLWFDEVLTRYEDKKFIETGVIGADSSIFEVFSIDFKQGDPATALKEPNSIVITTAAAEKYFGEQDPVGKSLKFNHFFDECVVTGVVENYPDNSHFDFEILLSLSTLRKIDFDFQHWQNHTFITYVLLHENVKPARLQDKFDQFLQDRLEPYLVQKYQKNYAEMYQAGYYYRLFLEPLDDVHLGTLVFENREGKRLQTHAIGIIGLVILILASINYVNLSTAISTNRAKEIGIRKTIGSGRKALIGQFLAESIVTVAMGMVLGFLLLHLILPVFNNLVDGKLTFNYTEPVTLLSLLVFALLIGLLGGLYPAIVYASFKPISIFGVAARSGPGKFSLRNGLVVFQFTICIILITSTLLIFKQLKFMQQKNLGFDKEHVVVIKRPWLLDGNQEVFKQELLRNQHIKNVSFTNTTPGRHFDGHGQHFQGDPQSESYTIFPLVADVDILLTLDLEVIKGKGFDLAYPDQKIALLNEAAASQFKSNDPLDQVIDKGTLGSEFYPVAGIVRDFHFNSFRHSVKPLVIYPIDNLKSNMLNYILVKIDGTEMQNAISEIEADWKKFSNQDPFDYSFLDQDFHQLFIREETNAKVYTFFSVVSIFIACLGILGLISYFTLKKKKEVGIRKIAGASTLQVVVLLSKNLTKWVAFAFLLSIPAAWYLINEWLKNFAFQTEFKWWIFGLAGIGVLLIALLTISFQTLKAALANPVEALRNE